MPTQQSLWKTAASVILLNTKLRQVLMLKRGGTAVFMPNSYVFPGGTLELLIDVNFPRDRTNFILPESKNKTIQVDSYADDFPLRVAAVRELFEESGLLFTFNENCRETKLVSSVDDPALKEWRLKVQQNPKVFPDLFFGSTKMDVNSLIPWSCWFTPLKPFKTKRYDTTFFVALVNDSPAIDYCKDEMTEAVWDQPSDIIARSAGKGLISLPPPQYYELLRIRLAFCSKKMTLNKMCNPHRIFTQVIVAKNDPTLICNIFNGDHLYTEACDGALPENLPVRQMTREEIFDVYETKKPIHRIMYRTGIGSPPMQYSRHEIHIKNIDKMPSKTHLFYFDGKDYSMTS